MNRHEAQCILKVRDALVQKDCENAYHWLYKIASPNFDRMSNEVWKDIERMAESPDKDVLNAAGRYAANYEKNNPGAHPKTCSFHGFIAGVEAAAKEVSEAANIYLITKLAELQMRINDLESRIFPLQ